MPDTQTGKLIKSRRTRKHSKNAYDQARRESRHKQHKLFRYYMNHLHPDSLIDQRLRFTGYLRGDQRRVHLNPYATQVQWQDVSSQAWLNGNIAVRTNPRHNHDHFQLSHGDVVRAEVFWERAWHYLWDMRVWDPDHTLAAGDHEYSANLYDDLYLANISRDDFHFKDVYCHEVLVRICHMYKIPVGQVAMGTYKIKTFDEHHVSPLDAIIKAYKIERSHAGHRFVMRWHKGKIHVVPLRRNPLLWVLHKQLIDATIHHEVPRGFATALTARGTTVNPKKTKDKPSKQAFTAQHNVTTYGYVHQLTSYSTHYQERRLEEVVKHELARRQQIQKTIEFDHPGIAFIRKGDATEVVVPSEGYVGWKSVAWVADVTHTVEPGTYRMAPTVTIRDPMGPPHVVLKNKNKDQRSKKRVARKRATRSDSMKGHLGATR